jgi:hypothetical protein
MSYIHVDEMKRKIGGAEVGSELTIPSSISTKGYLCEPPW